MKREKLDFTDRELYYIALAFQSFLTNRETWLGPKARRIIPKILDKIITNGQTRKNPQSILHPIYKGVSVKESE